MMKILVVSYDELNPRPDKEQVISDVCAFYNDAMDVTKENLGNDIRYQIKALINSKEAEVIFADTEDPEQRKLLYGRLMETAPDLLVSYNLAGFELCTLTDSLSYNLLDFRQIHFVDRDDCPNKKYLEKERSINIFVVERSFEE